jgi:hypothetical protein
VALENHLPALTAMFGDNLKKSKNQVSKLDTAQRSAMMKFQMLQASCFCMPFMLVDVGAQPLSCGLLSTICTAVLAPILLMSLKRPWHETILLTTTSVLFSLVFSGLVCTLLQPDQLIYGYMLAGHIPVTLPIVILLTLTIVIPMLVQVLWDSNKRTPSLSETTPLLSDTASSPLDSPELIRDKDP